MSSLCYDRSEFYERFVYPTLATETPVVLTGNTAFVYGGISVTGSLTPDVLTDNKLLDGIIIWDRVHYCYTPNLDYTNYVTPLGGLENVFVCSRERAIVESIKSNFDYILLDWFCDGLNRYQHYGFFNYELLCEVAEFYEISKEDIDFWLEDTANYN